MDIELKRPILFSTTYVSFEHNIGHEQPQADFRTLLQHSQTKTVENIGQVCDDIV